MNGARGAEKGEHNTGQFNLLSPAVDCNMGCVVNVSQLVLILPGDPGGVECP